MRPPPGPNRKRSTRPWTVSCATQGPAPAAPPRGEIHGLREGSRVEHPIFGTGTLLKVAGGERVDVLFDRVGLKRIHLGYTKLTEVRQ